MAPISVKWYSSKTVNDSFQQYKHIFDCIRNTRYGYNILYDQFRIENSQ